MLTFHAFNCVILQKIIIIGMKYVDLDLQKHLAFAALCLQNLHIPTASLVYYLTCICIFGALKFKPIIKSSYH